MLTRLSVGRVEPWELVLSVSLLIATILVTSVVAIRMRRACCSTASGRGCGHTCWLLGVVRRGRR